MADTTTTSVSSTLSQYSTDTRFNTTTEEESSNGELGKTEFLELMIAKLNNQDPLNPQDDAQFIAELAQFSTVEGIQNMSAQLETLNSTYKSSQVLEASSLVGGAVTVDGNTQSQLTWGRVVYGSAEIAEASDDLVLKITNSAGTVVEEIDVGSMAAGEQLTFKWDGANLEINGEMAEIDYSKFETDENGNITPHAEGEYSFSVMGSGSSENTQAFDVSVSRWVESVSIQESNQIQLNLEGGSTIGMDDVKAINAV